MFCTPFLKFILILCEFHIVLPSPTPLPDPSYSSSALPTRSPKRKNTQKLSKVKHKQHLVVEVAVRHSVMNTAFN